MKNQKNKSSNKKTVPGATEKNLNITRAEADKLATRGNFTAALELMASVLRLQAKPPVNDYVRCCLYAWNASCYQECRVYGEQLLEKHGRTVQTLTMLLNIYARLNDYSATLALGSELIEIGVKNGSVYSAMAHAACGVQDYEKSARYGELALLAKDADIPDVPRDFPKRKSFNPDKKTRNIICFSLWGHSRRYLCGAVRNAVLAHDLYPSWTCRFYLDSSVPDDVTALLRELLAQVIIMPRPSSPWEGLGWRFQVWDDPDVDFCLIRDCDSVFSAFETVAVNAWLRSERWFHVMRTWYTHTPLILAGMWGGVTGMLNNIYTDYLRSFNNRSTRNIDQDYLHMHAWPIVKQSALIHDRFHRLPNTVPFPDDELWPGHAWHVGMNEAAAESAKQELLLREYAKRCPSLRLPTTTQQMPLKIHFVDKRPVRAGSFCSSEK